MKNNEKNRKKKRILPMNSIKDIKLNCLMKLKNQIIKNNMKFTIKCIK